MFNKKITITSTGITLSIFPLWLKLILKLISQWIISLMVVMEDVWLLWRSKKVI